MTRTGLQLAREPLAEPHLLDQPLVVIQRHNAQADPASTNHSSPTNPALQHHETAASLIPARALPPLAPPAAPSQGLPRS